MSFSVRQRPTNCPQGFLELPPTTRQVPSPNRLSEPFQFPSPVAQLRPPSSQCPNSDLPGSFTQLSDQCTQAQQNPVLLLSFPTLFPCNIFLESWRSDLGSYSLVLPHLPGIWILKGILTPWSSISPFLPMSPLPWAPSSPPHAFPENLCTSQP